MHNNKTSIGGHPHPRILFAQNKYSALGSESVGYMPEVTNDQVISKLGEFAKQRYFEGTFFDNPDQDPRQDYLSTTIDDLSQESVFNSVMFLAHNAFAKQTQVDLFRKKIRANRSARHSHDALSMSEKRQYREALAWLTGYNKLLKQFINYYGMWENMTINNVAQTMAIAAGELDSSTGQLNEEALRTFYTLLQGVRFEMVFETMLSQTEEYNNTRDTTIMEDSEGIDYVIILPDNSELYIDIKSSLTGVHGKNAAKYAKEPYKWTVKHDKDVLILWPLIESKDFHNMLTIPLNRLAQPTKEITKLLKTAA